MAYRPTCGWCGAEEDSMILLGSPVFARSCDRPDCYAASRAAREAQRKFHDWLASRAVAPPSQAWGFRIECELLDEPEYEDGTPYAYPDPITWEP